MEAQAAVQRLLLTKYEELRSKNPQYSRRAFSRKIGLSAGAISEIFNGRRSISPRLAERIASRLTLDPQERADLLKHFPMKKGKYPSASIEGYDPNYLQLSVDQFRVIGEWYHFAILTLMRSRGFESDANWIAGRLGLSETTARTALDRLKRLGLVQEDSAGTLTRAKTRYRTSDDVANVSVKRAHGEYLEKARNALETLSVEQRDFTSLMLTLHPSQLPRAKEMIRKFQDDLSAEFEATPQPEVYQLLIQLFPLTRAAQKNRKKDHE